MEGRGSAIMTAAVVVVVVGLVLLHCQVAEAATYTVGWTFNVATWPKGKSFKAGDILVFNYTPGAHNVVAVNKAGYKSCSSTRGAKMYNTGKDRIKLVKGQNFFICNFGGHCQSGMKIAITAV